MKLTKEIIEQILNLLGELDRIEQCKSVICTADAWSDIGIFCLNEPGNRIPSIAIYLDEDKLEKLSSEFNMKHTGYGEIVMNRLLEHLIMNEDEKWIVDTDVLNWKIRTGMLRNLDELPEIVNEVLETDTNVVKVGLEHVRTYSEPHLYGFLVIRLNDYMS